MKITRTQLITLGLFALLVIALPVGVYLSQKRQDIRPRATTSDVYVCPFDCQAWNAAGPNCAGAPSNGCGIGLDVRTCTSPYTGCVLLSDLTPTLTPTLTSSPTPTSNVTPSITTTPVPRGTNPTATPTPIAANCLDLSQPKSDNFDSANLNSMWTQWSTVPNWNPTVSSGVLNAYSQGSGFSAVILNDKVCGNFDVRVDFGGITTNGLSEGDVRLSMEGLTDGNTIFVEKYSKVNEQGFSGKVVINGNEQTVNPIVSQVTSGKLRIRRVGSVVTIYYDTNDGTGFHILGNFASGFSGEVRPALILKSWNQGPIISANFDNFNLTNAILDPSITSIPPTATLTPIPTPPSGRDRYTIDVGDKQSLVINIGPAIAPQIRFKAQLASLRATPDMYLKMRVKDELAFTTNPSSTNVSSCNNAVLPDKDFYIPVHADASGVYSPVQQITSPAPAGAQVAVVSADGWVMLDGMVPGRYYTLYLKGAKTRKGKMVEHFNLQPNQTSSQDYDWTAKPLDPGDLPDPNNGNKQDCTINSTDWSLEKARIGSTDGPALDICDVNYDGICNAGDSVAILDTLSKRPDDDQ